MPISGVRLLTANVITPYRPTIASSSPSPPIEPRRTAPIRLGTKANTILSRMVVASTIAVRSISPMTCLTAFNSSGAGLAVRTSQHDRPTDVRRRGSIACTRGAPCYQGGTRWWRCRMNNEPLRVPRAGIFPPGGRSCATTARYWLVSDSFPRTPRIPRHRPRTNWECRGSGSRG